MGKTVLWSGGVTGGQVDGGCRYSLQYGTLSPVIAVDIVATWPGTTDTLIYAYDTSSNALSGTPGTEYWFVNTASGAISGLTTATSISFGTPYAIPTTGASAYTVTLESPFTPSPPVATFKNGEVPTGGWSETAPTTTESVTPCYFVGTDALSTCPLIVELLVNVRANTLVGVAWGLCSSAPSGGVVKPAGTFTSAVWAPSLWPSS
jgi:hypothetical protein